jgi:ElaB/YqjD/DUF883 family membrane-anchored ribosome-binding protein
MAEGQGEGLATIGEIAQSHGDTRAVMRAVSRTPFERLLAGWRNDADDIVTERPYLSIAVALSAGFLGGLTIAVGSRRGYRSRGW